VEKIKFKIRLSTCEDLEVSLPSSLTFLDLKKIIADKKQIPVSLQRVYLHGKCLSDSEKIKTHLKPNTFLQVFCLPSESEKSTQT